MASAAVVVMMMMMAMLLLSVVLMVLLLLSLRMAGFARFFRHVELGRGKESVGFVPVVLGKGLAHGGRAVVGAVCANVRACGRARA